MNIIILDNADAIAKRASEQVIKVVRETESPVLGLATGSTPLLLYAELVGKFRNGEVSFQSTVTFNLDEYLHLPALSCSSYRHYMNTHFFNHIDLLPQNAHLPEGNTADPGGAAERYEQLIVSAGGIDLQILGLGTNGHIGFNEPGSSFASRTRVVALTENTINSNRRYFENGESVPQKAITLGIGSIREARQLLLVATGQHKAMAVRAALEGPVSSSCPASAIQLHPNATIMLDREAASRLANKEYYIRAQHVLATSSSTVI